MVILLSVREAAAQRVATRWMYFYTPPMVMPFSAVCCRALCDVGRYRRGAQEAQAERPVSGHDEGGRVRLLGGPRQGSKTLRHYRATGSRGRGRDQHEPSQAREEGVILLFFVVSVFPFRFVECLLTPFWGGGWEVCVLCYDMPRPVLWAICVLSDNCVLGYDNVSCVLIF